MDLIERAPGFEVQARAALARGDLETAGHAALRLREIADAVGTAALVAGAAYVEGLLALAGREVEAARMHLEDAVDFYGQAGAPFERARARVALGHALTVSSREAAEREWRVALGAFEAIGAAGEAARVRTLLGEAAAPLEPAGGMSPREVEVLRLLASGRSNAEIAEALVLSVRTVERHISNIYIKLGAAGPTARATATAHAFQAGLLAPRS